MIDNIKTALPRYPAEKLEPYTEGGSEALISYRGYTVESFLKAYKEAGPLFVTEVNNKEEVCFGGLEANDLAWRSPDNWSYGQAVSVFREELSRFHLTQLDREPHRRKRRLLNKAFKNSSVMSGMPQMAETIAKGLAWIEGKDIELHEALMIIYTRAQALTAVKAAPTYDMIERMVDFEEGFIGALFKHKEERELIYNRSRYLDKKAIVIDFLHEIVKSRLRGEEVDDLLNAIIYQKTSASIEPLSEEELIYDAYLLLIAGTGNTSKTICYALNALANDLEWLGKLQNELDGFDPRSLAGGMSAFPLMKATLLEAERLFPAAPVLPRVPAADMEFLGYPLEEGSSCLHLSTLMHFDEAVYEDPYTFKPQRWIDNEYPKAAHGTFGGGSHICLGMNVSHLQMPLTLGYLISRYNFEITSSPKVENYAYPEEVDSQTVRMYIKLLKK
ncbi:MAG: cytochrome P450 [Verrucomicrobiota bacterium]